MRLYPRHEKGQGNGAMSNKSIINRILLAVFILLISFPFISMCVLSLSLRWPIDSALPQGFTLKGFEHFFKKDADVAIRSVFFSLGASAITLLIAVPAVRGMMNMPHFLSRIAEAVFCFPMLLPVVSVCIGGHKLLLHFGGTGTWAVMLMHVYFALPYVLQPVYSAYALLGRRTEVAAVNLGAGPIRIFIKIHLPMYLTDYILAFMIGFVISYSQYFVNFYFGSAKNINFSMVMTPLLAGSNRNVASVYTFMYVLFGSLVVAGCSILQRGIHRGARSEERTVHVGN